MMSTIEAWLRHLGLEQYTALFADNAIDLDVLTELSEQDFESLGIKLGHRRKLLRAIRELPASVPAVAPDSAQTLSQPAPEAERRHLTVMFCDMVGSTELAQQLDPEDLRELMAASQGAWSQAIERYEGYVARYMGDGILAYFGYPRAHEDDAERAVRAGMEILASAGGAGTRPAVRIGIASGLVVVGELVGEGAAQENAVVGETPNLAARLQGVAAPDTLVVSTATRELLGDRFDYVELGAFDLKGYREQVKAWQIGGEAQVASRFEGRQQRHLTQLVGRVGEMAMLNDRWEQAVGGDGQVVVLVGEAGIGKSRLTEALNASIPRESRTRLRYQCSPYHTQSSYFPFIRQLEWAAGWEAGDDSAQRLARLEDLVGTGQADFAEQVALLAHLMALDTRGGYRLPELTPERLRERLQQLFVTRLRDLSAQRAVLFVFEDVHWADPSSLDLLGLIIEAVQALPVLVVLTARPEFESPWQSFNHATSLTLNRLSPQLTRSMVDEVITRYVLPASVVKQIVEKTDGVPLFVEELTRSVLDANVSAGSSASPMAIPSTLQDSLMARLDRVPLARELAQTAAAIGREVPLALIAAMSSLSSEQLSEAIDSLVATGLWLERGTGVEKVYTFKHGLVQDAAYESMLRSRREQVHGQLARVLESEFAETTLAPPELLAHHCAEAGLIDDAIRWLQRAARGAVERSADREAVAHYSRALALIRALPESSERDRQELEFQIALCTPLMLIHGFASPETEEAYDRALTLCVKLGETEQLFPVLFGQWVQSTVYSTHEAAIDSATRLGELGRQYQDDFAVLRSQVCLGWSHTFMGNIVQARAHTADALARYQPDRHREYRFRYVHDARVAALVSRCYQCWALGFPSEAIAARDLAIDWGRELDHAGSLLYALTWGGMLTIAAFARDEQGTRALAAEVLPMAAQHELLLFMRFGRILTAWADVSMKRADQDSAELCAAMAEFHTSGWTVFLPTLLALVAEQQIERGSIDAALASLQRASDHSDRSGSDLWDPEVLRLRGLALQGLGRSHDADACFSGSLELATRRQLPWFQLRAATSRARAWHAEGRSKAAHDLLAPVYGSFTDGLDTRDLREAASLLDAMVKSQ